MNAPATDGTLRLWSKRSTVPKSDATAITPVEQSFHLTTNPTMPVEYAIRRRRSWYIALAILTILSGLLSRSQLVPLPSLIATYGGDTLWALVVFWCFCILFPQTKTRTMGIAAIACSFAVEVSQFYHAPWIDALRHTTLGGLILGFGFKWSDLVCYSLGILAGSIIDHSLLRFMASRRIKDPVSPSTPG